MMNDHLLAVLVHTHREPFAALRRALNDLSVETYSASSCKEAQEFIANCRPQLVFAESSVADGSWLSIRNMAEAEDVPLNVIVVGHIPDTKHYISVMERGAFDFVVPPFEHEPLSFLIKSAARDTYQRRENPARLALV
jgi:DNA-binding NtrC family response regulator